MQLRILNRLFRPEPQGAYTDDEAYVAAPEQIVRGIMMMELPMRLISLLLLGAIVAITTYTLPAISLETKLYTDKEFGFRVEYFNDWNSTPVATAVPEGAHRRLSIQSIDGKNVSACSFSVTLFPDAKSVPTSSIVSRMMEPGVFEDVLRTSMPNGRVVDMQRNTFGHQDAILALVINTVRVKSFDLQYKRFMAATERNGVLYNGFCFSYENTFPTAQELLRFILNTFAFI
jgi:hypothetical protein